MATDFILAPNGRWQGRDQTGQPVQHGKLYTYVNQTTTPKATYQDYQGLQPNTNPVILDGKGEANVYWAVDDLYTYKLFTEDDQEVTTQDNYPVVGTNTTRVVQESSVNIARNEQFFFWYFGTSYSPVAGLGAQNNSDYFCDDWLYKRVSSTYTVNLTRQTFALDQTDVPNNPTYYFEYQATTSPTGETNNRIEQRYENVQTLANQIVTVSLYAKSPINSILNVYLVQNFGTGGSPSAEVATLAFQETLTTDWQRYSGTITLPDLTGKTVGTNGDSALVLRINFPNDVIATIDLCDVQIQSGATLSNFPFENLDNQFKELNNRINDGLYTTGDVKSTFQTTPPAGWLLCNDTTIGNYGSNAATVGMSLKALYTLLWNNVTSGWCPTYDSAGVLTNRGASASDDWYANKQLLLTRMLGRAIATSGNPTGSWNQPFTADPATDLCTMGITDNLIYNATTVTLTTTGTLPAPLAPATTYFAVNVSPTTVYLATSAANAIAGTYINITDAGTGTHYMSITYASWQLGQSGGADYDAISIAQMPAHNHTATANPTVNTAAGASASTYAAGGGGSPQAGITITVGNTGTSARRQFIQPTIYMNHMIRK